MKRLRHPIRSITEPYGRAGLLVAVLALVLATTGAAFAATGLNGKQKKQVTAIAKKYAGENGAPGATGPQGPKGDTGATGPQGPKGDTGATGSQGPKGDTGNAGTPGTAGESVTISSYTGPECETASGESGAKFTNGTGTAYACNGENGTGGGGGSGLPATLGTGETETGTWSFSTPLETKLYEAVASFPVQLAAPVAEANEHMINSEGEEVGTGKTGAEVGCSGSAEEPTAEEGNLCVYTQFAIEAEFLGWGVSSKVGAFALFETTAAGPPPFGIGLMQGGWAVTAE